MLSSSRLLDRDGVILADVTCQHGPGRGESGERTGFPTIVFARQGCFIRSADGRECLVDSTLAYLANPGEDERYDHPHPGGDACTALALEPALVASLRGGEPELPSGPVPTAPRVDLQHRLLLGAARRAEDESGVIDRAIALATRVLETVEPAAVTSGRPRTERARRMLVDGARSALAADPNRSLPELARMLATSPHHLSRIFHAATGWTISRHRMRLRARAALERFGNGERDLSRLAADLGFADHSHLCSVLRVEAASTPSALRAALAAD